MSSCKDTMWPVDVSEGVIFAWGMTCAVISPFIVTFNVLLIFAMVKTKETTSFTARYVMCLSTSDIGMGLIVMPLLSSMLLIKSLRSNCDYQKIVQTFAFTFGYTSFFMLVAIGVDRYLLIKKLIRYRTLMNEFRWRLIVAAIVLFSITLSIVTVSAYSFPLHITFIFANVVCIGSIYSLYVKLLFRIDKQATAMKSVSESTSSCNQPSTRKSRRRRKRDISVARTVRLLLGAIFLLYMPYNIISSVWMFYKFQKKVDPGLALNISVFWTYVLMFVNGMINVLIYGHGNSAVRRYIMSFVGRKNTFSNNSKTIDDTESETAKHYDDRKARLLTTN